MADYDNRNRGSLFVNDKKQNDKQADRNGSAELCCPACGNVWQSWVDGWLKKSKDGTKQFLSLSFKPKDAPRNTAPRDQRDTWQAPRQPQRRDDF
jgi:hypothetical protein